MRHSLKCQRACQIVLLPRQNHYCQAGRTGTKRPCISGASSWPLLKRPNGPDSFLWTKWVGAPGIHRPSFLTGSSNKGLEVILLLPPLTQNSGMGVVITRLSLMFVIWKLWLFTKMFMMLKTVNVTNWCLLLWHTYPTVVTSADNHRNQGILSSGKRKNLLEV